LPSLVGSQSAVDKQPPRVDQCVNQHAESSLNSFERHPSMSTKPEFAVKTAQCCRIPRFVAKDALFVVGKRIEPI
jgi:hypothetical protein